MKWTKHTIPKPTGDAVGKTQLRTSNAPEEAPSRPDSPSSSGIPVTEVTEVDVKENPTPNPSFSMPVESTISLSPDFTDWTVSPIIFVESGLATSISSLIGLDSKTRNGIQKISEGTGDPPGAVIQQICEFFIEEESEWSEAYLKDALAFYVSNMML